MHKVFVYGSLREGFYNHRLLKAGNGKKLGICRSPKTLTMYALSGAYPGVVKEPGPVGVLGEVYEISDNVLNSLDLLEGQPTHYKRELMETPFGDAWVYIYQPHPHGGVIKTGDWSYYKESRSAEH